MAAGSPVGVPKDFDASEVEFPARSQWTADELAQMNVPPFRRVRNVVQRPSGRHRAPGFRRRIINGPNRPSRYKWILLFLRAAFLTCRNPERLGDLTGHLAPGF
jgi:hypothetical protein